MKKDLFGIDLRFYAVLAFVLAALGQTLICGLLLAAMLFVVKEEWATRQIMQAFFVCLLSSIIVAAFSGFYAFNIIPIIGPAISAFFSTISGVFNLIPFVFAIIGIVKTAKGAEANLPLFAKWARKAYGITEQKVYTNTEANTPAL